MAARTVPGNGRGEGGFTYIALLIAVAIIGAGLAGVATVAHTFAQRENEKQLLFVGNEFRTALNHFYATNQRYPNRLEELVADEGKIKVERHLRKLYFDPMRGKADWGTVNLPNGQIVGVYSLAQETPLKTGGFAARDGAFKDAHKYSEWLFLAEGQTALLSVPADAAAPKPSGLFSPR
jgi:type II secretory pathway pseudopilin PulG